MPLSADHTRWDVVETADGLVEVVVFAVGTGEFFRLEEDGDSVLNREPLPVFADQRFPVLLAYPMQRIPGMRASQPGNDLGPLRPCLVFAGVEKRPNA
jgi:hypothetical protein